MQKLFGYEDFLKYCKESGKRFVNKLDREDFIAYRAEYSVPREQVELIKKLLDFQKQKTVEEIYSTQNIFESAFEKFSDSVTIKSAFRDLPEEFGDKRVEPFLLACGLEDANFFLVGLPNDLTLARLPEYLAENTIEFDTDELKNFADALRFDVRACTKKIFISLFKSKREFDVVCHRAKGDTLEEIGKNFGITRERVRQIEVKSVCKFKKHHSATKKIF